MEITGFSVDDSQMVTINLTDLPQAIVGISNTSVSIAGSPLDQPERVSQMPGGRGIVVVFGGSATRSGRITVTITPGEDAFVATSAEEYKLAEEHDDNKPLVLSVTPTQVRPGDEVTMRGRHLGNRAVAAVYFGSQTINSPRSTPTAVTFLVPENTFPGPYQISLTGPDIGVRKATKFRIIVIPKE